MKINPISLEQIRQAQVELRRLLPPTPLLKNEWLSEKYGRNIYLKLENMQPVGSFKIRGATYKIARLTEAQRAAGVITASAGNHAQGVAWGARQYGVKSTIVMPKGAAIVKVQNTRSLGAEVVLAGETYDEAYEAALELSQKSGAFYIPAFEDSDVIAGQGTVGLEIFESLPEVDSIVGSIGGGGLVAGVGSALRALKPSVRILACQASGSPSMLRALREGHSVKLDHASTFADGIAVKHARESMRALLAPLVDSAYEVDDESTAAALLTLMERAKIVTEGAAAISLAALDQIPAEKLGQNVVILVCGGNIDVNVLGRVIERGLIRAGRRLRMNIWVEDRPGALARITALLAELGVNILQTIHDRSEPTTTLDRTEIELTLETKGPEHSAEVASRLKSQVLRMEIR
jgi:threonine dehydratase